MTRALLLGALCFALACGRGNEPAPAPSSEPAPGPAMQPQAPAAAKPAEAQPLQDAAGNLLPSGERVAWLELPRGLTRSPTGRAEEHLFLAQGIEIERIQAFFGARLLSGSMAATGSGGVAISKASPPSGIQPKQTTLDLRIYRGAKPDLVTIYIYEHRYVDQRVGLSDAEARALLKQQLKRAE